MLFTIQQAFELSELLLLLLLLLSLSSSSSSLLFCILYPKSIQETDHVTNWNFNEVVKRLENIVLLVTCRMIS
jgi:hypothetical protein